MNIRKCFIPLAIGLSGLALASCSASISIGGGDVEETLSKTLQEQYGTDRGFTVESVKCPEDADLPFVCDATVEGADQPVRVEVTENSESDDSSDNVHMQTLDTIYLADQLQTALAQEISAKVGTDVTVDCGTARVLVVADNSSFDCGVSDSTGDGTVQVNTGDGRVTDWVIK